MSFRSLGLEWVAEMPSVSRTSGRGTRWPFVVELTDEQLRKLRETVDYYDRTWTVDGIATRSAELYSESYVEFHAMAQALEDAYSSRETSLSEADAWATVEGVGGGDILIASSTEGFTLFCGESAERLLRNTVSEASRGLWPDPVIWGMREKF